MIIYFSGTGNSKFVADALAHELGDMTVDAAQMIKDRRKGRFTSQKPYIFVFPIYVSTIPKLFASFLKKSEFHGNKHFYFVATCAGTLAGSAPNDAKRIADMKGKEYMGCATVQMPQNYILMFKMTTMEHKNLCYSNALESVRELASLVKKESAFEMTFASKLEYTATKKVEQLYYHGFTKTKDFYATGDCIGCGLCAKVCPLNNITMAENKPVWKKDCIHCMACINKCPKHAIEAGKNGKKTARKERHSCPTYQAPADIKKGPKKILLAGAFGKLGSDILRALCQTEHEIIAADAVLNIKPDMDENRFTTRQIDVTNPDTLLGLCDGVDLVITTIGLTGASTKYDNYDIDYQGNWNLLQEAISAGVPHFAYISVINADQGKGIPMVHSKYLFEQALKQSGMNYVIYRPTGYFYDIAHVFWPMIKSRSVQLLKVKHEPLANVIDTTDFARFILETMFETNRTYNVGGTETYTYSEIAQMFYAADGVTDGPIKRVPPFLMDVLANLPKIQKEGKRDVIRFSKFTMTHDCYGDTEVEGKSFKEYIEGKSYDV